MLTLRIKSQTPDLVLWPLTCAELAAVRLPKLHGSVITTDSQCAALRIKSQTHDVLILECMQQLAAACLPELHSSVITTAGQRVALQIKSQTSDLLSVTVERTQQLSARTSQSFIVVSKLPLASVSPCRCKLQTRNGVTVAFERVQQLHARRQFSLHTVANSGSLLFLLLSSHRIWRKTTSFEFTPSRWFKSITGSPLDVIYGRLFERQPSVEVPMKNRLYSYSFSLLASHLHILVGTAADYELAQWFESEIRISPDRHRRTTNVDGNTHRFWYRKLS